VDKAGKPLPVERAAIHWPWGIIAVGVLALGWVGVYLLWNGFVFLSHL
jgi:hypothetical protein